MQRIYAEVGMGNAMFLSTEIELLFGLGGLD